MLINQSIKSLSQLLKVQVKKELLLLENKVLYNQKLYIITLIFIYIVNKLKYAFHVKRKSNMICKVFKNLPMFFSNTYPNQQLNPQLTLCAGTNNSQKFD